MSIRPRRVTLCVAVALALACGACKAISSDSRVAVAAEGGWLSWRGPWQNGVSGETELFEMLLLGGENHLWTLPLAGRGTPVVADGRVFALGYEGEGAELEECLVCVDERTGEVLWERRWNDYLSDSIYGRYAIGSPTIDPATGDGFAMSTAGELMAFTADGRERWRHSLMAEFGRLTFPNGRTGAPLVDGGLVIVRGITTHWGPQGPARDRFYAFDAETGSHVWTSTPGVRPVDSSFSMPVLEWRNGRRVLYATTGCGNVVCLDARSGEPLWRFQLGSAGLNSAPVLDGERLIAINGKENFDNSTIGRMVALSLDGALADGGPRVLEASCELWRNPLIAFTSSPVLAGGAIYQTTADGSLCRVDPQTGEVVWREKLAPDQIHASPAWADGKLYVPMNDGSFHIVRPGEEAAEVLCSVQLQGNCLGAPAIANGRVYVHTTAALYCFGSGEARAGALPEPEAAPARGAAVRLQLVPADVLLRSGEHVDLEIRSLDARGGVVESGIDPVDVTWGEKRAWDQAELVRADSLGLTAARGGSGTRVVTAEYEGLRGGVRVRVVPRIPFAEDFEDIALTTPHAAEAGVVFARPPSEWLGITKKWEGRKVDGGKVLAKTLDVPLFQRSQGFIGHPLSSDYTMRVDIRSEGNRRSMSSAGVIHQRYLIQLKGNHQALEVSSNVERLKESVPFRWKPGDWYTLETRVDVGPDGSGVVRARVWPRGEPAPQAWTIEVPHARAHAHGSPGLFGFAPQSRFRVYLDNLSVIMND
ncbi:MAG: hypothetical protein CMJ84_16545 [Planctomycetes bacterium]|nr:hypothetical protein [Planctomycetota bacterium]